MRQSAPDARVWAVAKANAYGHGLEHVFAALRAADGFALLDLSEAQRLRALDWRGPILLLEGCFEARDLELCSRLNLWHVVHCSEQIDWLAAHKTHTPHRVFLKLNSGMNRLGFTPNAFRAAWARLNSLPQVDEISLITHFSDADGDRFGQHGWRSQLEAFLHATADLPGERSLCNSAAALRHAPHHPALAADWVRPGIALYGAAPDHPERNPQHWQLQPAMTLSSQLIGIQQLQAGEQRGLWLNVCGPTRHAAGRGGVRLCRWLSAPRTGHTRSRHPNTGARRAHTVDRAGQHGHADRGLDPGRSHTSAPANWATRWCCGATANTAQHWRWTRWHTRQAPSVTNCCARCHRACPCALPNLRGRKKAQKFG